MTTRPPHTSQLTRQWKIDNNISAISWPAQSPDINIIENLWRTVKSKLVRRAHTIKSKQTLIDAVLDIWASITPTYIKSLYNSLPSRIRHVLRANRCIKKY